MNNVALAQSAYGTPQAPVRNARSVEYQAFAKVTSELVRLKDKKSAFVQRIGAIHENRRLWDILMIDVASENNELPDELRAGIFSLARFVARHTTAVLKDDASVEPLIEINTSVMRGLRGQTGES